MRVETENQNILKSRLGRRIFFYFLLIGIIPIAIFSYFSVVYLRNELIRKTSHDLARITKITGGRLFQTLLDQKNDLRHLSGSADLRAILEAGDRKRLVEFVKDASAYHPAFSSLCVTNLRATLSVVSGAASAPPVEKDQMDQLLKGSMVNSPPVYFGTDPVPAIVFSAPVLMDSSVIGVISGTVKKEILWDVTQGFYGFSRSDLYVLDGNGRVLASSTEIPPGASILTESERTAFVKSTSGIFRLNNKALGDVICSHSTVFMRGQFGIPDWVVLHVARVDDVLEVPRTLMAWFATLCVLSVLTITLVASTRTREFIRPIKNLLEGTRRVSTGDLGYRVDIHGDTELDDVAKSFNDMMGDLMRITVSKNYMENIVNSCIDTVMVVSPDGHVQTANHALCDLTGYSELELVGRHASLILEEGEIFFGERNLQKLAKNESVKNVEVAYRTKSGEKISMSLSAASMRADSGKLVGFVCVARDMREIHKLIADRAAAEERGKAAELERMASLGRLAGGVAHEFNNALSGILGMAELIKRGIARGDEIDIILKEGERAGKIVQDLLLYAKPRIQQMMDINISDVIQNVMRIASNDLKIRQIKVDLRLPAEPLFVRCDESKIEQVLLNLVINARDAMPDGGEMGLAVHPEIDLVRIDIADSGPGIPGAILPRIFEPFFTTKERGKGTGLGLSVVAGIIHAHDGTIRASNRPEGGALFTICLPASKMPSVVDHFKESAAGLAKLGGQKILVVDDEPSVLDYCKRVLENLGNNVTVEKEVDSALRLLKEDSFDAVLSDHAMPGKNGLQLLQALRQGRRAEADRFILMTGLSPEGLKTDVRILLKPFKVDQLMDALASVGITT